MRQLLLRLWKDDEGALLAVEWLFMVVIMVLGLIVGFTAVRNSIVEEFAELGNSLTSLDQSFRVNGLIGCGAETAGTDVRDQPHRSGTVRQTDPQPHTIDVNLCESF
jgi:Flp pilus assembly pilin Flp